MHGGRVHSIDRTCSVDRHAPSVAFLVGMKVLECRLGIPPAIIAASAVEIDQPQPFDLDTEAQDLLGPFSQNLPQLGNPVLLDLERLGDRGGPDQVGRLLDGTLGDSDDLRQQVVGLFVRELLLVQCDTPFLHEGTGADSMRTHTRDLRTVVEHDGLTIEGKSIAGNETYFRVKELKIALDIGRSPDFLVGIRDVFVTHAHVDHALGIPFHAAQRKLQKLPPSRIHVPSESLEGFRSLIRAHEDLQTTHYRIELVGVGVGEDVGISKRVVVRGHEATHSIPARAWEVIERRETLRAELRELEGSEIRARRDAGERITDPVEISRLFYTGDTDRQILERGGVIFASKVLMIECTFTAEDDRERAAEYRHIHLDDIFEFAERYENEIIFLTHFSLRDRPREIVDRIDKRCPAILRDRLRLAFPPPLHIPG